MTGSASPAQDSSALASVTLRRLKVTPVRVPATDALAGIPQEHAPRPLILLDLETYEGPTGHAYLAPRSEPAFQAWRKAITDLTALLENVVCRPFENHHVLNRLKTPWQSIAGMQHLLAAVDVALWDIFAQLAQRPLVALLGATPGPVPAFSRPRDQSIASLLERARLCLANGLPVMCVALGHGTVADDLSIVDAICSVVGHRTLVAVDYRARLSSADAFERCTALRDLPIAWIADPLRAFSSDVYRELCKTARAPIMIGRPWQSDQHLTTYAAASGCKLVSVDPIRLGGISLAIRTAQAASTLSLPTSGRGIAEVNVHLMRLAPRSYFLEVDDVANPILQSPLRIHRGFAYPNETPGNGLRWDTSAIDRYRCP